MPKFTQYQEWMFNGDLATWYEAEVNGIVLVIEKVNDDFGGRGNYLFYKQSGPIKSHNRRRTLKEAKMAALETVE